MENNYQYVDPNFTYTNANGVLHNLAKIEDEKVLLVYESLKVTKRIEELFENPIKIKDTNSLLVIHHYLFQDHLQFQQQGLIMLCFFSKY
jgi:cell filamentation protein